VGAVSVAPGVYWVGAVDWNIRWFHGPAYSTHRGTSYNAYLIVDDKVTLVDTVYAPFTDELLGHITEVVPLSRLDYVVVNHIEPDHAGAFPHLMKLAPQARVFCSPRAAEGLKKKFGGNWELNLVKTGDKLSLGRYHLTFIEAPMLHWPDSMFTYLQEHDLLLPNDAFGQHLASSVRFDDEMNAAVLLEEAAKYYANILWPFSPLVLKKLDEIERLGLSIRTIAPSHGLIWRKDPGAVVAAYRRWAAGGAEPRAVIAYDSMWGSTEKMAHAIGEGLRQSGVPFRVYKMLVSDRNDVIRELLDARALLVGSGTINGEYLPTLAPLLDDLVGLKPAGKLGMAFGSYGWGGGAVKAMEARLQTAGIQLVEPGLGVKWAPTPEELQACTALGKRVAERLKSD